MQLLFTKAPGGTHAKCKAAVSARATSLPAAGRGSDEGCKQGDSVVKKLRTRIPAAASVGAGSSSEATSRRQWERYCRWWQGGGGKVAAAARWPAALREDAIINQATSRAVLPA